MSPWNFIWLLIPPINLIVMTVWCFKICRTRHKSSAFGFLLLIPVINILAYFYLAFSRQKYPAAYAHA
jgi:bacteriorhodopsin